VRCAPTFENGRKACLTRWLAQPATSIQHARPQGAGNLVQGILQRLQTFTRGGHVDDHVADVGIGLQVLAVDVGRRC